VVLGKQTNNALASLLGLFLISYIVSAIIVVVIVAVGLVVVAVTLKPPRPKKCTGIGLVVFSQFPTVGLKTNKKVH
jgi:ABC-type multidrug transport system permease subunit